MRLFGGVGGFVVLSVVLGCPALGWASAFTFTSFDVPNAISTIGYGINDAGMIVGQYQDKSNVTHGFLRDRLGTFLPIDVPSASPFNATSSYAFAINSSGLIVGDYTSNNVTHGYLKDATGFHTIDVPSASPFNATSTLPYGINGAGEVVGTFVDTANKTHGYLQDAAGFHAIDVPNAASTEAYRVNQSTVNGSKIVGDYTDNSGKTHGFYTADKGTTFKTIDIPNADTELYGINNAGKIVGIYDGANNTVHSFLTTDLGSTFTEFNFSTSASKTFANDINNYDTIVGSYRYPTSIDFHGFIADPPSSAPEPSTLALVAAGMASFALSCLRRRARVRPARGQTEEAALR